MIIAFWPITALFFDGRNHNNRTGIESFFTTAHVVLYAGMTVFALYVYHYYTVGQSLASIVVSTIALLGPTLLMLRRWRVPDGTFTVSYLCFGLLMNIMTEYRDAWTLIALTLTGLAIDLMQRAFAPGPGQRLTLGGIRLTGTLAAVVLWFSYFGLLALEKGIGWKPTTSIGVVVIGIGTAFATSFLVAPPAYEPRLAEGD